MRGRTSAFLMVLLGFLIVVGGLAWLLDEPFVLIGAGILLFLFGATAVDVDVGDDGGS